MVIAEATQMVASSVVLGVILGLFYGWMGAQLLLGFLNRFEPPQMPGMFIPTLAGITVVLAVILGHTGTTCHRQKPNRRPAR